MDNHDRTAIRIRIAELRQEHRDLDAAIALLEEGPYIDQLQLRRFKKRKLQIKDQIALFENQLIPDEPA
jgi:hypothetical protein